MKILQFNLNHCEAAHDLLMQTVRELELDIVLIAEPYKHLSTQPWESDSTTKAVIWSCGKHPFQDTINNDWATSTRKIALNNAPICAGTAEEMTTDLMKRVTQACDASIPRKRGMNQRPSVHWWNDHISALRKECLKKRRISQRGYRQPNSTELIAEYKQSHQG